MTDNEATDVTGSSAGKLQWQASKTKENLDLLILGDTAFGANYQEGLAAKGKTNILEKYGYDHGFEHVEHILQGADLVVANLETPLTTRRDSPFKDIRPYIHYDDPDMTLGHLLAHNITAVTLANNHTHDMGEPGLLDTIDALDNHGVLAIGAGRTLAEATRPLQVRAELTTGAPFSASIFTRFRGGSQFRDVLKAYATETRPGSAPLKTAETARAIKELKAERPDEFVVVTPHWRRDYAWTSDAQRETAQRLIGAGASLIVGHGSHMAQEIDFLNGRLVLNGIGNFLFNSPGRYKKLGVPPYSMMVRLTVDVETVTVRIYPIHTDNRETNFQPRPVNWEQFQEFYSTALAKTNDSRTFLAVATPTEDQYGHHLAINLRRDGRLRRSRRRNRGEVPAAWDPQEGTFRFNRRMNTGSLLLERELGKLGGTSMRLDPSFFVGQLGGETFAYESTSSSKDSVPAVRATQQKDIARSLLERAGLSVAQGHHFSKDDREEALEYAQKHMPVVVKPVKGNKGNGVSVDVRSADEFRNAWSAALAATDGDILVEEHFTGSEGRFVVVGGKCLAVTRRIPPFVVGDGVRTIRELIIAKNEQRYETPHLHNRPITLNADRLERMQRNGFTPLSVLDDGYRLVIDYKGGLSTGAENADITDEVDPSFLEIAGKAGQAFPRLELVGVDILGKDFSEPASSDNHIICEVNNQPGIGSHHFPSTGRARNIAGAVIQNVAEPESQRKTFSRISEPEAPTDSRRNSDAVLLAEELRARGFEVSWYSRNFLIGRSGGTEIAMHGATTGRTGHATVIATRRPAIARQLLERSGVPLARQEVFTERQQGRALKFASRCSEVVLHTGDRAGVRLAGADRDAFRSAWEQAAPRGRRGITVQQRPPGVELSFLISHGRVLAVQERTKAGQTKDVTEAVHRSYQDTAARAALAFPGLDLAEVILITKNVAKVATEENHWVMRVRSAPDLVSYSKPDLGEARPVVETIIEHHLSPPAQPDLSHPSPVQKADRPDHRLTRKGARLARRVLNRARGGRR